MTQKLQMISCFKSLMMSSKGAKSRHYVRGHLETGLSQDEFSPILGVP